MDRFDMLWLKLVEANKAIQARIRKTARYLDNDKPDQSPPNRSTAPVRATAPVRIPAYNPVRPERIQKQPAGPLPAKVTSLDAYRASKGLNSSKLAKRVK